MLSQVCVGVAVRGTIYFASDGTIVGLEVLCNYRTENRRAGETMSENASANSGASRSSTAAATEIPHEERRSMFEYVAEHGPVRPRRLREELFPNDRRAFRHHRTLLERDGYLVDDGDRLRVTGDLSRLAETETVERSALESPVEFRPANGGEYAELIDVVRSVAGKRTRDGATATVADDGTLQRGASEGVCAFYVATVESEICGWAQIEATAQTRTHHTATITGGVAEERRGAGIGTRLLEYTQKWTERCGYEKLYQYLPATNRTGIDFLTDRGWVVEATRDDHYLLGDTYVDDVILSYAVDGRDSTR